MNNFKKIGLSALAGSLVAMSAQAGDMSVTGSSAIYIANSDENAKTGYSMSDSVTFSGSTELDNGLTYSFSLELDGDAQSEKVNPAAASATATSSNVVDSHSIKLSSDSFGTLTFAGHGGTGVLDAWDDVTPNAYEESWDVVSGADASRINGTTANNSWGYVSPSFSGATLRASYYTPSSGNASTYTDIGISISPEMVEGLTVGAAWGTSEATAGTEMDESTFYIKYAYGPVTVGYQESEIDSTSTSNDDDFEAYGITYQVTDDLTLGYTASTYDAGDKTTDQENSNLSASYTMGGMTLSIALAEEENRGGSTAAKDDVEGYAINLVFAF